MKPKSTPDFSFEERYGWPRRRIAGVDEAGRGALAGPVVAAAVIFSSPPPEGINDSKTLTPEKRTELAKIIHQCGDVGIGIISPARIDEINILQASLEAMRDALTALPSPPDLALIDGIHAPTLPYQAQPIKKGDRLSLSIAAASIIAKTHRDGLMKDYHQQWPDYGFDKHMGYPTATHKAALQRCGVSTIHRRSYAPVRSVPLTFV